MQKKNNIQFKREHGYKFYIWDEKAIRGFVKYFNRKTDKILMKINYIKQKKELPKKNDTITIREIACELCPYPYHYEEEFKKKMRVIQYWAKKNNIPYVYHFGRKYYVFNKKRKKEFLKYHFSKNRNCQKLSKELIDKIMIQT